MHLVQEIGDPLDLVDCHDSAGRDGVDDRDEPLRSRREGAIGGAIEEVDDPRVRQLGSDHRRLAGLARPQQEHRLPFNGRGKVEDAV